MRCSKLCMCAVLATVELTRQNLFMRSSTETRAVGMAVRRVDAAGLARVGGGAVDLVGVCGGAIAGGVVLAGGCGGPAFACAAAAVEARFAVRFGTGGCCLGSARAGGVGLLEPDTARVEVSVFALVGDSESPSVTVSAAALLAVASSSSDFKILSCSNERVL